MISLLTGLAIGLVFGMPVGAAGIMSMQRTLSAGPAAGFITGMGSSVAVCLYGALGFFGPSLLFQTFLSYQKPIVFAGAILAVAIGVLRLYDFLKPERPAERTDCQKSEVRPAGDEIASGSCEQLIYSQSQLFMTPNIGNRYNLISFALGLAAGVTNPVSMLGLSLSRSVLNADWNQNFSSGIWIIIGIFAGMMTWWFLLTAMVEVLQKKTQPRIVIWFDLAGNLLLIMFGISVFIFNL